MTVTPHTREFKDLAPGDCFAWRNHYLVKLSTNTVVKWSGKPANAVCLLNGEPQYFEPKAAVTYLPNARIVTE